MYYYTALVKLQTEIVNRLAREAPTLLAYARDHVLRGPYDGPAPPINELEGGRDEFSREDIIPLGQSWLYLLQGLYPDVPGMDLLSGG